MKFIDQEENEQESRFSRLNIMCSIFWTICEQYMVFIDWERKELGIDVSPQAVFSLD